MQNLFAFFYRYAFVFLFLLLEFICIRLIIGRNASQREIYINSSSIISGKLMNRIERIKQYFGLQKINTKLAEENAQLRALLANNQLANVVKIDSVIDTVFQQRFVLVPAQLVNNSVEHRNNMITINKGYAHGIKKYSPVIEPLGIVGFVKEVGSEYSTVMSILNSRSRVSVMVGRTRYIGNLIWNSNSPMSMSIEAIPKHGDVRVGDTIVTTNYSHFPTGHPVGIVTEAFVVPGENFFKIEIRLLNDLAKTNFVYVVEDLHRGQIDSLEQKNELK